MLNQALGSLARLSIALALTIVVPCAHSQSDASSSRASGPSPALSAAEAQAKGQALLASYVSGYRGRPEGVNMLIRVLNHGLPRTTQNTTTLRALLAGNMNEEEKVVAIRVLAMQYEQANPTGMNHLILADLKQQADSASPRVAGVAVFAYTRLGYMPDSLAVLKAARDRAAIDTDSYFGELGHLLTSAPAPDQLAMARMIRAARNGYARDVVTMIFTADGMMNKLTAQTRQELAGFLDENEPRFSINVSQYDLIEASRYQYWLRSIQLFKASAFNKDGAEVVLQRLSVPLVDTRKLYAFFTSPYAPEVLTRIPQRERYTVMMQRMASYPGQFPDDPDMGEVAAMARATLMKYTR